MGAYVFTRSGTLWTQVQKLDAPADPSFGKGSLVVDTDGTSIAVAAMLQDGGAGAVHIFNQISGPWVPTATVAGGLPNQQLGAMGTVISGNLLVGVRFSGIASIYEKIGSTWTEEFQVTSVERADVFGNVVVFGDESDGKAYVYEPVGASWAQTATLSPSPPALFFGSSVSIDGNTIVVGARGDNSSVGSAFVYTGQTGPGTPCTSGTQCPNGLCIDGVCCDQLCGDSNPDDCQACSIAAGAPQDGFCSQLTGTTCNDADQCTVNDTCTSGSCNGQPANCNDSNACTTDGCSRTSGCTHVPIPCNDSSLCTTDSCNPATGCIFQPVNCDDGKVCTDDTCNATSGCVHTNNTAPCTDNNFCTLNDTCTNGTCVGGPPPPCSDGNPCTDDSCSPATGCVFLNNTATCTDNNACTVGDRCTGGSCAPGTPTICNDTNDCTTDSCNIATGLCNFAPVSGTGCNDNNFCTLNDTCVNGTCTGGPPLPCDDSNVCTNDSCVPATGCAFTNNTAACSDGSACTVNDVCSNGLCQPGPPQFCNDFNVCTDDSCDPLAGCRFSNNAASCDDFNLCTPIDTCSGGECLGGGPPPNCNDGNQCTTDSCDAELGCQSITVPDGTGCDDGTICTTGDECSLGVCTGPPLNCDDSNDCTTDSCDPINGCQSISVPDGNACSDGSLCTIGDSCLFGLCIGTDQCDDGNDCTADSCDPRTGCQHVFVSDGTGCSDGNACTVGDACLLGECQAGGPMDCSDGNPCTADICTPAVEVICSNPPITGPCDDGDACTLTDSCVNGACEGSLPVPCFALDQCHDIGTCNPATGVCDDPIKVDGSACSDGDACSQTDTCQGGSCVGTNPFTCVALDQCHNPGTCNPSTGVCDDPPKADGTTCNDGLNCTSPDACTGGICSGTVLTCDDSITCTVDSCTEASGCFNDPSSCQCTTSAQCDDSDPCNGVSICDIPTGTCQVTQPPVDCSSLNNACNIGVCNPVSGLCGTQPRLDGTTCSDGNACTQTDSCLSGACEGSSPVVCTALDQCHNIGTCNPATGVCDDPIKVDGSACSDGDACSQTDTCQGGSCVGTNPFTCVALDQCHSPGTCNPSTGVCDDPPKADGTTCNDGLNCTSPDACTGGICGGTVLTCDDSITCTVDSCTEASGCFNDPSSCQCTTSAQCDDSDPCNGVSICDIPTGTCQVTQPPVDCSSLNNACNIGVCNPVSGLCGTQPRLDGTTCSDGNACTQTDSCLSGACEGSSPVVCTALDQCHNIGTCNPATGVCDDPIKVDGSACSDGDACSQTDTCQGGSCVGANPVNCVALDQCHSPGTCDPFTGGCSNPPKTDGTTCSDGLNCTSPDACTGGICGGTVLTCDDSITCTVDSCTEASGCFNDPSSCQCTTSAQCDDSDPCNGVSICDIPTGTCQVTQPPVDCSSLNNACNIGVCNPVSGLCGTQPRLDGTTCSDGNACTQTDSCLSGACEGSSPVVCTALDQCHIIGTCNPATGVCDDPIKVDGSACSDGDACSQTDTCQGGSCVGANPVNCVALDQCHSPGTCDPFTGGCSNPPKTDGTTCSDGLNCTSPDACTGGICTGTALTCDDSITCTVDSCTEATGCFNDPSTCGCETSAQCDDANPCNGTETCNLTTFTCTVGTPVDCTSLNDACNIGVCNATSGACETQPRADGTSCTDGDACTVTDTCTAGTCIPGPSTTCNDTNVCTADTCDSGTGQCVFSPVAGSCNDGNACTLVDSCQGGLCVGSSPVVCTALDQCHDAGACIPTTGVCSNPPKADGATCTDNNACTTGDSCVTGACTAGAPTNCNDANLCTNDSCNPASGCVNSVVLNGTPCNVDGNLCTFDTCQAGQCNRPVPAGSVQCVAPSCSGSPPSAVAIGEQLCDGTAVCPSSPPLSCGTEPCNETLTACQGGCAIDTDCPSGFFCQAGSCAPQLGDGGGCNRSTMCQNGNCTDGVCCNTACGGGDPSDCQACNVTPGVCAALDGTACSDSDACTTGDTCAAGVCTPATPTVCDDGNGCTSDTCDAVGGCQTAALANGTACSDGNACTSGDSCQGGSCAAGGPTACDDGNLCTMDACDIVAGCVSAALADDTPCGSDGNQCTFDVCKSGQCQAPVPNTVQCRPPTCTAGTATVQAFCDGAGACPGPQTVTCALGACDTSGILCLGCGSDADCPAAEFCGTAGSCVPDLGPGVTCQRVAQCASGSCTDGVCCDTVCGGGAATDCVACSVAAGAAANGTCAPVTNGRACDDASLCTTSDACQAGTCVGGGTVTCTALDACHDVGTCNASTGVCSNPLKVNGAACDDGNTCTSSDACQAGACAGTAVAPAPCDVPGTTGLVYQTELPESQCVRGTQPCGGVCAGYTGPSAVETCDGIDNDCDGLVDDGIPCGGAVGQPCAQASDCASDFCADGVCCDTACGGSVGTDCMACSTAAGAAQAGRCGPVTDGADCATGFCRTGACQPPPTTKLGNGSPCVSGLECTSGSCADLVCCDQACDGACEACTSALRGSGQNGQCGPVAMGSDPDDDCADEGAQSCGDTGVCNGAGACTLYAAGTVCAVPPCAAPDRQSIESECDGAGTCQPMGSQRCQEGYACVGYACLTLCSGDADCLATHHCESSVCVRDLPLGAPCTESGRCQSNNCVDGVCCESACDSECEACEASKKGFGADGICEPITADTDPDDECTPGTAQCSADGFCDGSGACRDFAKPTAPCGATTCAAGEASGSLCDGAGNCSTNTAACAPYACNGDACGTTCTGDTDCATGAFCTSASTCAPKKVNGASCEMGAECVTGLCIDAFCCDGVCGQQCAACDVEGSRGTCTGVTGAPHGDRMPCADDGAGCAGFCDGQTRDACIYPADDTACGTSSCDNGEATYFACNSAGACVAQTPELCSPFACETSGEACNTDCESTADCAAGFECDVEARDCVVPPDQGQCLNATTVLHPDDSEERCEPYACVDGACLTECTADTDCAEGWRCFGDVCDISLDGGIMPEPPSTDPSGCDCSLGGRGDSSSALWAALLAALAAARRRRSRPTPVKLLAR